MRRMASTLVLVGGVGLLAVWAVPSASSSPAPDFRPHAVADTLTPQISAVNAQVDHLQGRLETVPDYPQPSRDPFAFGRRPEAARPAAPPPEATVIERPAPTLPRLVAIFKQSTEPGAVPTAVFAAGNGVAFVKAGERQGPFVVDSISDTSVVLSEPESGATFGLSLQ
jgi:hypothetical protein